MSPFEKSCTRADRGKWLQKLHAPCRDLASPMIGPQHIFFEDYRESIRRCFALIDRLGDSLPEQTRRLDSCARANDFCLMPGCPICSRERRRYMCAEILRLYDDFALPCSIVTLYIDKVPAGWLNRLNVEDCRTWLRQKLRGAGLGSAVVVGGFELNLSCDEGGRLSWLVHVHAIVFGAQDDAYANLRRRFEELGVTRAVDVREVRDPVRQISYLTKFFTYYRPLEMQAAWRSLPIPMPKKRLAEYIEWLSQWRFEQMTFCLNAQQRGSHIQPRIRTQVEVLRLMTNRSGLGGDGVE